MNRYHSMHARHARVVRFARRRAAQRVAMAALFFVAACGGATEPGAREGTATVNATGAVSASGSGVALFQSVSSGGTSLFQIMLAPTTATTAATWQVQVVNYSGRLATGTYPLTALSAGSTNPTASFYYTSGGSMTMYNATSGELVLTASSPTAVRGTFHFTGANVSGAGTVTADGTFNAQCAPGMACQ